MKKEKIVNVCSDVFTSVGMLKNRQVKLHIKTDVQPVAQLLHHTSYNLCTKVEEQIDKLLKADKIHPADVVARWANPIVLLSTTKKQWWNSIIHRHETYQ